jgi:glyoxylase-like metal-dependent hydrolase (beta-lactamase superfamily II)
VNTFLINTGSKLVLVDTGAGNLFGPTMGKLLTSLRDAGYQPEQVDDVLITHMHGDHVGGLSPAGQRAFPNAVIHADQREADYWLSPANRDKAPADAKGAFKQAMTALQPYVAAGRFKPIAGGTEIVPGIKAVPAPGHTTGHSCYAVESKGQKLLLWGDLLHVAAVQFPDPSVTITFDTDSNAARAQRVKTLAEAASQGYWVGGAHIAFPGLGHVRTDGKGYAWVPANETLGR